MNTAGRTICKKLKPENNTVDLINAVKPHMLTPLMKSGRNCIKLSNTQKPIGVS